MMPIKTVDSESVRLRNQAAFIRTSDEETENGGRDIAGDAVDEELVAMAAWAAMKVRRRRETSSFASRSHL
jgi:hypothetical protein